jgi:hypothetical protein
MRKSTGAPAVVQSTFPELKDMKTSREEPTQLLRVEHTVVTRADRELAWRVFSNVEMWPRFSDLYGDIRWLGEPWMAGSHMNIELKSPVGTVVDHVITVCTPPHYSGVDRPYTRRYDGAVGALQAGPDGRDRDTHLGRLGGHNCDSWRARRARGT